MSTKAPRTAGRRFTLSGFSVRVQILAALGVVALVAAIVVLVADTGLRTTSATAGDLYTRNVQGTYLAGEMKYQMVLARYNAVSGGYASDPAAAKDFNGARDAALAEIGTIAQKYIDQAEPNDEQLAILQAIRDDVAAYADAIVHTDELVAAGKTDERESFVASTVAPLGKRSPARSSRSPSSRSRTRPRRRTPWPPRARAPACSQPARACWGSWPRSASRWSWPDR